MYTLICRYVYTPYTRVMYTMVYQENCPNKCNTKWNETQKMNRTYIRITVYEKGKIPKKKWEPIGWYCPKCKTFVAESNIDKE